MLNNQYKRRTILNFNYDKFLYIFLLNKLLYIYNLSKVFSWTKIMIFCFDAKQLFKLQEFYR